MEIDVSASHGALCNLGPIEQIPVGEGRTFRVQDAMVAIFRGRDGQVFATQPTCPHRGGPLADGVIGASKIVCPLHSFTFSLVTGEPLNSACQKLRTYPVALSAAGDIVLPVEHLSTAEGESATSRYN
jgi:nitrite reductase (NADH) small subunit